MEKNYRMIHSYLSTLLDGARKRRYKEKARIEPLESIIYYQFTDLQRNLQEQIYNLEDSEDKLRIQNVRNSLLIATTAGNILRYTYWKDIPKKAWKVISKGLKHICDPKETDEEYVHTFLELLTKYHIENLNFSFIPNTSKAIGFGNEPVSFICDIV